MTDRKQMQTTGRSDKGVSDPRFASISTDPRYRLPSTKNARVGVDKRFSRMFKDDDFTRKAKVDRYGRTINKDVGSKSLKGLYKQAEAEEQSDEEEAEDDVSRVGKGVRPKKREIALTSASEDEEESDEVDDDSRIQAELERLDGRRDPAREGGFSSSSEESSSEEEDEEDDEVVAELPDEASSHAVPMGEVSSRIAIVNLDWDNMRATDLLAVAQSFVPSDGGGIKQVSIYPSEFGKERMEREELEGPPREIFTNREGDAEQEEEDSEEEEDRIKKQLLKGDDGEEFDSAKLRQYQLDRLRYHYAVVTCDSNSTAKALYDAMDGREYLLSLIHISEPTRPY